MVKTIAAEIGSENPVPVVLTDPEWNVETLRCNVESRLLDALMVQRNRLRISNARTGIGTEVKRAGRGVVKALSSLGPKRPKPGGGDGRA
jgi:hypothetical protein